MARAPHLRPRPSDPSYAEKLEGILSHEEGERHEHY